MDWMPRARLTRTSKHVPFYMSLASTDACFRMSRSSAHRRERAINTRSEQSPPLRNGADVCHLDTCAAMLKGC